MTEPASPFGYPVFRRLFAAQVINLLGTGLSTIALTLLAYDLSATSSGVIIGVALAIKMIAYVACAPLAALLLSGRDTRVALVSLNLVVVPLVALMSAVSQAWQAWALIFLISASAAAATPAFQATFPSVVSGEVAYTKALSLSRVAYELEVILSPLLAATILGFISYQALFLIDSLTFVAASLLIASVALPAVDVSASSRRFDQMGRIARLFTATPSLRGLVCLNLTVACVSAMVIVNTVALAKSEFGASDTALSLSLAAAGAGSIVAALATPRITGTLGFRMPMLAGGAIGASSLLIATAAPSLAWVSAAWFMAGVGMGLVQTPIGRLLRNFGQPAELPRLFAAQFSASHACWLLTYPVAGISASAGSPFAAASVLGGIALLATLAARLAWPPEDSATERQLTGWLPRAASGRGP